MALVAFENNNFIILPGNTFLYFKRKHTGDEVRINTIPIKTFIDRDFAIYFCHDRNIYVGEIAYMFPPLMMNYYNGYFYDIIGRMFSFEDGWLIPAHENPYIVITMDDIEYEFKLSFHPSINAKKIDYNGTNIRPSQFTIFNRRELHKRNIKSIISEVL